MEEKIIVRWEFLPLAHTLHRTTSIEWTATASQMEKGLFLVRLIATMPFGHVLVSQCSDGGGDRLPTRLKFDSKPDQKLVGSCVEIGREMVPSEEAWVVLPGHRQKISYMQKLELNEDKTREISGSIRYQEISEYRDFDPQTILFNIPLKDKQLY
ncbi:MAG: hypothetical protein P4L51_28420 [Puia sp.]|nr:hypothetical protein [Puia sp.]